MPAVVDKVTPLASATGKFAAPRAVVLFTRKVPSLCSTPPVKVFAPVRSTCPAVVLINLPVPPNLTPMVPLALMSKFVAVRVLVDPVMAAVLLKTSRLETVSLKPFMFTDPPVVSSSEVLLGRTSFAPSIRVPPFTNVEP